ncbi:hypothetical protein KO488_02095 [Poseidonibacter lekithochrous]|uniref:hypothetical protein n=1 Tax=Poseidonibacter TaxID=2321187 RepID=UPI001C087CE5|nr:MULTISPECIES: hypothetical protein [Poseidonibacter]MBU3013532.1 hypothetical protein [Poseidonibacter lekithochrous]MDO6826829.1 hypothetical protein [Poseidonibacter sp. 1_MG-2023]
MNKNYILVVFEGLKTEEKIFNNLKQYFLNENSNTIVYGFHCGEIYSLYNKLENDKDLELFTLLKENLKDTNKKLENIKRNQVSELYLFFDYDGHAISADDRKLEYMLNLFNDETSDYGKLYISYPMVEAIKHLKNDIDFKNTVVESNKNYKIIVSQNCNNNLQHLDKLCFTDWNFIINENSKKANFIVNNTFIFPTNIIEQLEIFNNQKTKYINVENRVSVLSAFPIFLLDYYGVNKFKK